MTMTFDRTRILSKVRYPDRHISGDFFYAFRSSAFARNSDSVVCIGAREQLEGLLGAGMLSATFFGYALYRDPSGAEYIGVWGIRNASKLRRLLRERGAQVVIHRKSPPEVRLHHFATNPGART